MHELVWTRPHDLARDPPRTELDTKLSTDAVVHEASGDIEIEIQRVGVRGSARHWTAGKRGPIERRAITIVRAVVLEVQKSRREAEAARVRHLKWEEERKQSEIEETRRQYDRRQLERLDETIAKWERAETVRRFAMAGRAAAIAAGGANEAQEAWLRWVEAVARWRDSYGAGIAGVVKATTPEFARP